MTLQNHTKGQRTMVQTLLIIPFIITSYFEYEFCSNISLMKNKGYVLANIRGLETQHIYFVSLYIMLRFVLWQNVSQS